MNRMMFIAAISVALSPFAAQAQTASSPYVSVAVGINKMPQEDVNVALVATPGNVTTGEVLTKTGPAVTVSVGKEMGNWRAELEGSYRSNKIRGESGVAGENHATGTENKYGVMANAIYDFGTSTFHPFLGAGIGGQFVHEPTSSTTNGSVAVTVQGATKGSFAYQGIAGLAFPIQSVRGMTFTIEYHYLALNGDRTYKGTATVPGAGSFALKDTSTGDRNHTVLVGIRFPLG
jgi:OOP family OmpA-OmpF porin